MKPNWNRVYILVIILVLLTGGLGYGFALAFDAHSTLALVGGIAALLIYAPTVAKISSLISKEFDD